MSKLGSLQSRCHLRGGGVQRVEEQYPKNLPPAGGSTFIGCIVGLSGLESLAIGDALACPTPGPIHFRDIRAGRAGVVRARLRLVYACSDARTPIRITDDVSSLCQGGPYVMRMH